MKINVLNLAENLVIFFALFPYVSFGIIVPTHNLG